MLIVIIVIMIMILPKVLEKITSVSFLIVTILAYDQDHDSRYRPLVYSSDFGYDYGCDYDLDYAYVSVTFTTMMLMLILIMVIMVRAMMIVILTMIVIVIVVMTLKNQSTHFGISSMDIMWCPHRAVGLLSQLFLSPQLVDALLLLPSQDPIELVPSYSCISTWLLRTWDLTCFSGCKVYVRGFHCTTARVKHLK